MRRESGFSMGDCCPHTDSAWFAVWGGVCVCVCVMEEYSYSRAAMCVWGCEMLVD